MKTTDATYQGRRYCTETFNDLYEFMEVITTRPDNKHTKKIGYRSSDIESDRRTYWTGTASWDESIHLMNGGYTEGLRMIESVPNIKRDPKPRRRIFADVVGVTPHIPNVVMDIDPRDMWNIKRIPQPSAEVNLYYDVCAACDAKADRIARAARILLDTISAIEMAGTKVNLYVMFSVMDKNNNESCQFIINLKKASQQLNPLMMAYPLVHPSFLRRQAFRWEETTPIISYLSTVKKGYCSSCSNSRQRERLIGAKVLTDQDYYVRSENLVNYDSVDDLVAEFNKQSELKTARAI